MGCGRGSGLYRAEACIYVVFVLFSLAVLNYVIFGSCLVLIICNACVVLSGNTLIRIFRKL